MSLPLRTPGGEGGNRDLQHPGCHRRRCAPGPRAGDVVGVPEC